VDWLNHSVVFLEKLGAVCEGEQLGLELFVGFGGF
jgi:hypothetical protein